MFKTDPFFDSAIEKCIKEGDVRGFRYYMSRKQSSSISETNISYGSSEWHNNRNCWIFNKTLIFIDLNYPGLFGATESEELVAAHKEAVAIYNGLGKYGISEDAASEPVKKLANIVKLNSGDNKEVRDFYVNMYEVKKQLRKQNAV